MVNPPGKHCFWVNHLVLLAQVFEGNDMKIARGDKCLRSLDGEIPSEAPAAGTDIEQQHHRRPRREKAQTFPLVDAEVAVDVSVDAERRSHVNASRLPSHAPRRTPRRLDAIAYVRVCIWLPYPVQRAEDATERRNSFEPREKGAGGYAQIAETLSRGAEKKKYPSGVVKRSFHCLDADNSSTERAAESQRLSAGGSHADVAEAIAFAVTLSAGVSAPPPSPRLHLPPAPAPPPGSGTAAAAAGRFAGGPDPSESVSGYGPLCCRPAASAAPASPVATASTAAAAATRFLPAAPAPRPRSCGLCSQRAAAWRYHGARPMPRQVTLPTSHATAACSPVESEERGVVVVGSATHSPVKEGSVFRGSVYVSAPAAVLVSPRTLDSHAGDRPVFEKPKRGEEEKAESNHRKTLLNRAGSADVFDNARPTRDRFCRAAGSSRLSSDVTDACDSACIRKRAPTSWAVRVCGPPVLTSLEARATGCLLAAGGGTGRAPRISPVRDRSYLRKKTTRAVEEAASVTNDLLRRFDVTYRERAPPLRNKKLGMRLDASRGRPPQNAFCARVGRRRVSCVGPPCYGVNLHRTPALQAGDGSCSAPRAGSGGRWLAPGLRAPQGTGKCWEHPRAWGGCAPPRRPRPRHPGPRRLPARGRTTPLPTPAPRLRSCATRQEEAQHHPAHDHRQGENGHARSQARKNNRVRPVHQAQHQGEETLAQGGGGYDGGWERASTETTRPEEHVNGNGCPTITTPHPTPATAPDKRLLPGGRSAAGTPPADYTLAYAGRYSKSPHAPASPHAEHNGREEEEEDGGDDGEEAAAGAEQKRSTVAASRAAAVHRRAAPSPREPEPDLLLPPADSEYKNTRCRTRTCCQPARRFDAPAAAPDGLHPARPSLIVPVPTRTASASGANGQPAASCRRRGHARRPRPPRPQDAQPPPARRRPATPPASTPRRPPPATPSPSTSLLATNVSDRRASRGSEGGGGGMGCGEAEAAVDSECVVWRLRTGVRARRGCIWSEMLKQCVLYGTETDLKSSGWEGPDRRRKGRRRAEGRAGMRWVKRGGTGVDAERVVSWTGQGRAGAGMRWMLKNRAGARQSRAVHAERARGGRGGADGNRRKKEAGRKAAIGALRGAALAAGPSARGDICDGRRPLPRGHRFLPRPRNACRKAEVNTQLVSERKTKFCIRTRFQENESWPEWRL
ncbi:Protein of unknown function [Gryllus bimaculatus]|nr:Protein of unknown function [Gryllus bimaculatus]